MRLELALIVGILFFCIWCAYIMARFHSSVDTPPSAPSTMLPASTPATSGAHQLFAQSHQFGPVNGYPAQYNQQNGTALFAGANNVALRRPEASTPPVMRALPAAYFAPQPPPTPPYARPTGWLVGGAAPAPQEPASEPEAEEQDNNETITTTTAPENDDEQPDDEEPSEDPQNETEELSGRRSFSEDEADVSERDRDGKLVLSKRRHLINGKPVRAGRGGNGKHYPEADSNNQRDFDRLVREIDAEKRNERSARKGDTSKGHQSGSSTRMMGSQSVTRPTSQLGSSLAPAARDSHEHKLTESLQAENWDEDKASGADDDDHDDDDIHNDDDDADVDVEEDNLEANASDNLAQHRLAKVSDSILARMASNTSHVRRTRDTQSTGAEVVLVHRKSASDRNQTDQRPETVPRDRTTTNGSLSTWLGGGGGDPVSSAEDLNIEVLADPPQVVTDSMGVFAGNVSYPLPQGPPLLGPQEAGGPAIEQQQKQQPHHLPQLILSSYPVKGSESKTKKKKKKYYAAKYKDAKAHSMKRKSKMKKGSAKKHSKKRKSERHFQSDKKDFRGSKRGKKWAKGAGSRGADKGALYFKDKGYKKRGFKKAYHKLETGDHKTYFDEFRDKDHNKKWKNFKDKHKYSQSKQWAGADKKRKASHKLAASKAKASKSADWRERHSGKMSSHKKAKSHEEKFKKKKKKYSKKKKKKKKGKR